MTATSKRRIDTHQHIVPENWRNWLRGKGVLSGGKPIPYWDIENAFAAMEENSVETAILSVSTPGVEPAETVSEGRRWAHQLNEYTADIVAEHPTRLGFFATLTLPDVEGAVASAEYALDELSADGVVLLANSKGVYLGDPSLEPLMELLNDRAAVIFVHPSELALEPLEGVPAHTVDFLLDTTRAALNLARAGCMERYPELRIILSHAGGFLPFAAYRMAGTASNAGDDDHGLQTLRRFYFDTALSGSPSSLPSLLEFAEPTHITFGSDFPFAPGPRVARFTAGLDAYSDANHAAINRSNAEALFPRFCETAATDPTAGDAQERPSGDPA